MIILHLHLVRTLFIRHTRATSRSFECRKVIGFAFNTLRDWLKRFTPLFHPIRSKTKTNCDALACIFPRFASATCNYFEFWLVHCIVCVLCDWLLVLRHSNENRSIELMTFALTWCTNIFVGCSETPHFFQQIVSFSDSFHHTKKQTNLYAGGGGGVLPYKGLMGTCGQPGYVFRDFCLKQGIKFINFLS